MTAPLVVSIPHSLGKVEAHRRLKSGLRGLGEEYGRIVQIEREEWNGDRLSLQIVVLKQIVSGIIDVEENSLRVEVVLPWYLAGLAQKAQTLVQQKGALLLEKK